MEPAVKFKKLRDDVEIPKYMSDGASGFDLASADEVTVWPGQTLVVKTGLACELPWHYDRYTGMKTMYELQVRPRSGTSLKTNLRIVNSPGTVDVDYRGEIGIIVQNVGEYQCFIQKGERIAQGVICQAMRFQIKEVTELSETARGEGCLGSTGTGRGEG